MAAIMNLLGEVLFYLFLFITGCMMVQNIYRKWKQTNSQPVIEVKKYFYLKETVLCIQCDCIFSIKDYAYCPSCGSRSTYYHMELALLPDEMKKDSLKLKGVTIQ